jgi:hypothetical protein
MKKSELKQLIKEEVKTVLREEERDEENNAFPWANYDGWNEDFMGDMGLMEWLSDVEAVAYEIRNAQRGSYGIDGDSLEDLMNTLSRLQTNLGDVMSQIENEL